MLAVGRRDRSRWRREGERLLFLGVEQFSEMTGRPLDQVRAEFEAESAALQAELLRRAKTLIVRPYYHRDLPVEFGAPDDVPADAEDLEGLGVSSRLIERLRTWQDGWEARASIPADPLDLTPGRALSIRLTRQLQSELPTHEVYLDVKGDLHAARDLAP